MHFPSDYDKNGKNIDSKNGHDGMNEVGVALYANFIINNIVNNAKLWLLNKTLSTQIIYFNLI